MDAGDKFCQNNVSSVACKDHKGFAQVCSPARAQVLSKDYQKGLLEWIEPANLRDYLGGTSRAMLLD